MPQYPNPPLSQKPNTIRLLRLLPSKDEQERLRCELFQYDLQVLHTRNHLYEALSYVWGGEGKPKCILITGNQKGDQELAVTQNLHTALLHLRDPEFPRIIWVDAVCINQSDEKEKEHQIRFMATIYAKASRVIVWLGEAQAKYQALESIRIAGERSAIPHDIKTSQLEIIQLLERPWFQRIWILQEMAAARHVVLMCGSAEIDGHAFCLGLDVLRPALGESICLVVYLIRGAIFRSRQISMIQGKSSLDVCPLGELIDRYHNYKATKRHDKIYALLGISLDGLSVEGLQPDYNVPWDKLMLNLVKFLVGDRGSIKTWNDKEVAVIKNRGCILGKVSSITTKQDNQGNVQIRFQDVRRILTRYGIQSTVWTLPSSAKPIQEGDIICLLQGRTKPTIVRSYNSYFAIIMIAVTLPENVQMDVSLLSQSREPFDREFLLVWDWEESYGLQNSGKYDTLIRDLANLEPETRLDTAIRLWNSAQLLGDLWEDEMAMTRFQEAKEELQKAVEKGYPCIKSQFGLIPLLCAASIGYDEIITLLLLNDDEGLDLKDWNGRTPLSWAAGGGHEVVAKLLIETGKVDIDSKDRNEQTPLSWAAEGGHETVVKLLIEMDKADVDSKDSNGQTPLSWAAEGGHLAVVKLLVETGKVDVNSKDYSYGQTPLAWAAEGGHEAVVKLLIEMDKVDVDSKDSNGQTPLSWAIRGGHEAVVKLLKGEI